MYKSVWLKSLAFILVVLSVIFIFSCGNIQTSSGKPYLVLYAFKAEGVLLSQQMTITDSLKTLGRMTYIGKLAGKDIVLAESGMGISNAAMATQFMIDNFNPKALIFSGIAGGIDSTLNIGDITVCRKWVTHDYGYFGSEGLKTAEMTYYDSSRDSVIDQLYFETDSMLYYTASQINSNKLNLEKIGEREPIIRPGGIGASGNAFIDNKEKRFWLSENCNAIVVDMESASVAQVCAVNGLPFIIIRSASDLAGGSGSETATEEIRQFFKIAANNSAKVVTKILELSQ